MIPASHFFQVSLFTASQDLMSLTTPTGNRRLCLLRLTTYFCRPTKAIWHGSGQEWGGSDSSLGTCNEWSSDSPLGVGLSTKLGDPSSSLLAPQRIHCNKELVVLCVESTSPSSVYARRKRETVEEIMPSSQYQQMLDLIDQDLL